MLIRRAAIASFFCLLPLTTTAAAPTAGLNLSLTCANGNPMWMSSAPTPRIYGVIIKFVSKAAAQARIALTETGTGATIDPAYLNNQRVVVQAAGGREWYVLVPTGMAVRLGEPVFFTPGYADPSNLCLYTPNLIALDPRLDN